ncbi:MAG: alpha/beta fold hydrolase [Gammaproteobacteria bacterium]|nr:alpha/beta fold hydrolase [Gammaproteobacteria bacterium]
MVAAGHVCFAHGKESGPWGTKIRALAEVARARGWSVESLDFQGMEDPHERVAKLTGHCRGLAGPPVLAGSSMGGFVAAAVAAALPVRALFLMAPAFYVPGYEQYVPPAPACPVTLVHGWRDDVVPWEGSVRYAATCRAQLTLLDGDHRLTANLPELSRLFGWFLGDVEEAAR